MTRSPFAQKWRAMKKRRGQPKRILLSAIDRRPWHQDPGHAPAKMPGYAGITLRRSTALDKLLALLKSRKFWAALVGVLMVFLAEFVPDFPLDAEQVTNVIYVLVAFILGTALEDGLRGQSVG